MIVTSEPLRLLYILDNYWPNVGGAERAFKALCEGMAARGHAVTVLTSRIAGSPDEETAGGVRILRAGRSDNRYAFTAAGIGPALKLARDADVIHSGTFNAAPVASIASMLTRTPSVLTVFETWIGRWHVFSDFPRWKAALHDLAERAIFTFPFDRYVGISHATSDRMARVVRLARGRNVTVYFDFDPTPWHDAPDDPTFRDALMPRDAFLVVAYGRPGTSKGFRYLVDAFAAIRERIPGARLALVLNETPQYARELRALKARAPEGVTFLNSLGFHELVSLVRSANCVVVPSLTEGFGYTTLEACAAGVPVVASDTTSIPEVVGGRFVMVPPRDAAAISRAVVAVSQGITNERPLRTFPLADTLDGYEAIYARLVATRSDDKDEGRRTDIHEMQDTTSRPSAGISSLIDERISAGAWTPPWVRYDHVARYEWISGLVRGKNVIDAACGTGYGSDHMIRAGASSVAGYDVSHDAVLAASRDFKRPALSFAVADVTALPVPDASIDTYVSFETIEHVADVEAFLKDALRVLRPGGTFVCSTPNRNVTNPGTALADQPYNPYHLREYDPTQLRDLLGQVFVVKQLLGQSFWNKRYVDTIGTGVRAHPRVPVRVHQLAKLARVPFDRAAAHWPREFDLALDRPEALVAVCQKPS